MIILQLVIQTGKLPANRGQIGLAQVRHPLILCPGRKSPAKDGTLDSTQMRPSPYWTWQAAAVMKCPPANKSGTSAIILTTVKRLLYSFIFFKFLALILPGFN